MTQVEVDQLNERVAWLERKMVRVLWLLVSIISAFAGLRGRLHYRQIIWIGFDPP